MPSQIWCQNCFPLLKEGPPKNSCSKWPEPHFSFGIFEIKSLLGVGGGGISKSLTSKQASKQPYVHYGHSMSRSARRDGATKNNPCPLTWVSKYLLTSSSLLGQPVVGCWWDSAKSHWRYFFAVGNFDFFRNNHNRKLTCLTTTNRVATCQGNARGKQNFLQVREL